MNIILATAGYDKQIKFWNIKNSQCYESKKFGDSAINKLVLSQDKKYLGACTNGLVKVYDLRNLD
jgi:WD40 repeat protein